EIPNPKSQIPNPKSQIPNPKSQIADPFSHIHNPLQGLYQLKNLRTVLAVISILRQLGYAMTGESVYAGIERVVSNTGLQGRWQILRQQPLTICDSGHNEAGIREVVQQLSQTPHQHLHMVFGMVNDKEIGSILALLPKEATYYFCKANIPRGLDARELNHQAEQAGLKGKAYGSVKKALISARKTAGPEDLIFIGGSTFVVAEVL
ncbi:MAG: hypothetical protein ABIK52_08885, partial [Bacteroidota bacterium]